MIHSSSTTIADKDSTPLRTLSPLNPPLIPPPTTPIPHDHPLHAEWRCLNVLLTRVKLLKVNHVDTQKKMFVRQGEKQSVWCESFFVYISAERSFRLTEKNRALSVLVEYLQNLRSCWTIRKNDMPPLGE